MVIKDTLFLIPARGGSKGLPKKNILPLDGKPLIYYTIDAARSVSGDENICVSSDDAEIIKLVESYGLNVPFIRPSELSADSSGSREVILHAIDFYANHLGISYKNVCLLQPTSPLRTGQHIFEAFDLWSVDLDMVVSVRESKSNPYYNLFKEDETGNLRKLDIGGNYTRRQDAPVVYEYNGAIYIMSVSVIQAKNFDEFEKIRKYTMDDEVSSDIDTFFDLLRIEYFLKSGR
jgi:CMP-N,N'-diacetyllegionaminic acid synthase